jgi:hypothetical protein
MQELVNELHLRLEKVAEGGGKKAAAKQKENACTRTCKLFTRCR